MPKITSRQAYFYSAAYVSRDVLVLSAGLFTLIISGVFALGLGATISGPREVVGILLANADILESDKQILLELRLPRILLSILVGGCLALSGGVMQAVFRNPLADPGLVGVSAGSALGAGVAIVLSSFWIDSVGFLLPLFAFIFGLLAMAVVYGIAKQGRHTQVATLLLAGVALSAFCTALNALMIYLSDDQQLRALSFWQLGSFGGVSWSQVWTTCVVVVPATLLLTSKAQAFNVLLLGESQARHLGIEVERLKVLSLVLVSLIVSVSVAMVGVIGFVGLVIPHIIRLMFGADHRLLLPASFVLGAWFLLMADSVARTLIFPAELPIGILTALLGCPFFIYLLIQHRNKILF